MNKKKKIIIISAFCITVIAAVIIIACIYNHKDTSLSAIGNIYESNAAGLVETENLIYYVSDIQMGYINVYDKNTKATSVLCNNPECKHNTPSCVASVFEPRMCINTLCTYNNNLYYVDYDISAGNRVALYMVSMDGSSKDNILTVYEFPDGEEISLQDINISSNGENIYMGGGRRRRPPPSGQSPWPPGWGRWPGGRRYGRSPGPAPRTPSGYPPAPPG